MKSKYFKSNEISFKSSSLQSQYKKSKIKKQIFANLDKLCKYC